MPSYISFVSQGWKGLVAQDWLSRLEPLQDWITETPGESIVDLPSREVRRINTVSGVLFVKLLHAGGSLEGLKGALTNIKWYFRPSRALSILRISQELLEAGFRCPVPVLAARRRSHSGWPLDAFISLECPGISLTELLPDMGTPEREKVLAKVADVLHRFHQKGFVHGDCIPGNLALAPEGEIVFFDHDRTVRHPMLMQHQQRRNLVQFGFRLSRFLRTMEPFEYFLAQYADKHWPSQRAYREKTLVMTRVRQRLQKEQFSAE